jgi:Activator of Hsp90 ATPase homolog 1-like protein
MARNLIAKVSIEINNTVEKDFNGRKFEDKGEILEIAPPPQKTLKYTHYSSASGRPDAPENYQTVSVTLKENAKGTTIELRSNNNAGENEKEMTERIWAYYFQGFDHHGQ